MLGKLGLSHWHRRRYLRCIGLILSFAVLPVSAGAANFEFRQTGLSPISFDSKVYEIVLTGEIAPGDADQLETIVSAHLNISRPQIRLRLISPGGSLEAGIDLGNRIRELGLSTFVGENEDCMSSCAIAFMSGVTNDGDGTKGPTRVMHHKARIGFHAPFAFRKGQEVSEEVRDLLLADAERGAHRAGSMLLRLSVAGILPTDLVEELLLVEQDDFLLVDTVDRAGRWEVFIENALLYRSLDKDRLEEFCSNIYEWRDKVAFEDRRPGKSVVLDSFDNGTKLATMMIDFNCDLTMVDVFNDPEPAVSASRIGRVLSWKALPGNVRLETLGPEEVDGATGPTWTQRFPPQTPGSPNFNFDAIRKVSGTCFDGLYWSGGWDGPSYDKSTTSRATAATCGGGFGPFTVTCAQGVPNLEFRFAYRDSQQPNTNGLVFADLDGRLSILKGINGDVHGHPQVYVTLPRDHGFLQDLKAGQVLKLIGEGPNQVIHLKDSRKAIEAMELSCK